MLENHSIEKILFLDIETVPRHASFGEIEPFMAPLWEKKALQLNRMEKFSADPSPDPEQAYERAGIYAEFGKIICISTGVIRNDTLWLKSFSGDDEVAVLTGFTEMLLRAGEKGISHLCAHNGKEFDYPYLIRRMLINGLPVPPILDLSGKKPWEVTHLDTMELWKFGDYKSYTSLELLAGAFGIPTPKDDIRGSDVARVYWQDHDLERIVTYCCKDVATIVNIFLRFQGKPVVPDEMIRVVG